MMLTGRVALNDVSSVGTVIGNDVNEWGDLGNMQVGRLGLKHTLNLKNFLRKSSSPEE